MATNDDDTTTKVSSPGDLSDTDLSESSDAEVDTPTNEEPEKIEWLVTSRAKRSTAGNRMKSLLSNEAPAVAVAADDSDLELLFAEDEDDAGFTDDEKEDASDVQMDSSSDDEDQENNEDEDEGEKELQRQAKEKRKRKAQDAIPAKFRKKVRIEQPATAAGSASPSSTTVAPRPPRPKKKSERASWLPSVADMPTRASERSTTRISKQQLHQKMVTDEIRRQKQLERMEKKAKLLEASKKLPMTQEERLAEAAIVEKRNSKSLNRWEEAEKQREEERLKKIAALNNRKLHGPVVTFWSGIQELSEAQSNHVGNLVSMEVKAPRKKRQSAAAILAAKEAGVNGEPGTPVTPATPVEKVDAVKIDETPVPKPVSEVKMGNADAPAVSAPPAPAQAQEVPPPVVPQETSKPTTTAPVVVPIPAATAPITAPIAAPAPVPVITPAAPAVPSPTSSTTTTPTTTPAPMAPPPIPPPPPDTRPPSTSGVLAAPILARPVGITPPMLGAPQMPMLGFSPPNGTSNVLALPNTSHTPSPLSLPPSTPSASTPAAPIPAITKPQPPPITTSLPAAASIPTPSPKTIVPPPPLPHATPVIPTAPATSLKPNQGEAPTTSKARGPDTPVEPPSATVPPLSAADPPREGKVTRSCIILQNFDEAAIKDKQVQTQILFGRKMNRLASEYSRLPPPPSHFRPRMKLTAFRTLPTSTVRHHKSSSKVQRPQDGFTIL